MSRPIVTISFFILTFIRKNGEKSEYKNWFTIFDYPVRLIHRPHLYANTYKVGWDGNEEEYKRYLEKTFDETKVPVEVRDDDGPIVEPSYKAWWGVPDMPKVNFESKEARQWALDVTKHWIENFDIDGWRMDVAKELDFSFWNWNKLLLGFLLILFLLLLAYIIRFYRYKIGSNLPELPSS